MQTFEEGLLREFFSPQIQARLHLNWLTRKFSPKEDSLVEFFYNQRRDAQYIEPKQSELDINLAIFNPIPERLRSVFSAVKASDSDAIHQALLSLDSLYNDRRSGNFGFAGKDSSSSNSNTSVSIQKIQTITSSSHRSRSRNKNQESHSNKQ